MEHSFQENTSHLKDVNFTNGSFDLNNGTTTMLPLWCPILFILLTSVIMILAIVGNALIVIVEMCNKMKTSTDWLVLFMSVNDFIIAIFNLPVYIMFYSGLWSILGSDGLCKVTVYLQEFLSYASTLILSLTAIDRFIKTCRPHAIGITPTSSKRFCIAIMLATGVLTIPVFFTFEYDDEAHCHFVTSEDNQTLLLAVVHTIQISFLAMFIIVTVCYVKIACTIRHTIRSSNEAPGLSYSNKSTKHNKRSMISTVSSNKTVENLISNSNSAVKLMKYKHKGNVNGAVKYISVVSNKCGSTDHCNPTLTNVESISKDVDQTSSTDGDEHNTTRVEPFKVPKKNTITTNTTNTKPQSELDERNSRNTKDKNLQPNSLSYTLSQKVHKTTAIMFAVTVVFILSWIPPWIISGLWLGGNGVTITQKIIFVFARRSFIINTCTNPIFYISMSSVFRQRTKQVIISIKKRFNKCHNSSLI